MTKLHFKDEISIYKPSEVRIFWEELVEIIGAQNKRILKFANKISHHPEKVEAEFKKFYMQDLEDFAEIIFQLIDANRGNAIEDIGSILMEIVQNYHEKCSNKMPDHIQPDPSQYGLL